MVDAKNARRVNIPRDQREQDQNARERPVSFVADETRPQLIPSHWLCRTAPPFSPRFFTFVTSLSTREFVAVTTTNRHERGDYRCDIYSTSIFTKKRSSYCGAYRESDGTWTYLSPAVGVLEPTRDGGVHGSI